MTDLERCYAEEEPDLERYDRFVWKENTTCWSRSFDSSSCLCQLGRNYRGIYSLCPAFAGDSYTILKFQEFTVHCLAIAGTIR